MKLIVFEKRMKSKVILLNYPLFETNFLYILNSFTTGDLYGHKARNLSYPVNLRNGC